MPSLDQLNIPHLSSSLDLPIEQQMKPYLLCHQFKEVVLQTFVSSYGHYLNLFHRKSNYKFITNCKTMNLYDSAQSINLYSTKNEEILK